MLSSIPTAVRDKKLQMGFDHWLPQVRSCCGMQFTAREWQVKGQSGWAFLGYLSLVMTISYRRTSAKWFNNAAASDKKQRRKRATQVHWPEVEFTFFIETTLSDGLAEDLTIRRKKPGETFQRCPASVTTVTDFLL